MLKPNNIRPAEMIIGEDLWELLNIKNCTVDHVLHCFVAENYDHGIYLYLEYIGRCLKIVIKVFDSWGGSSAHYLNNLIKEEHPTFNGRRAEWGLPQFHFLMFII